MVEPLVLPLPPSINASHITRVGSYKRILTSEARAWMEHATLLVSLWVKRNKWEMKTDFFPLLLSFYLKNKKSDSHNYKKLLFDALEYGGLCINDKLILDRTMSVQYDKTNPRIEITF